MINALARFAFASAALMASIAAVPAQEATEAQKEALRSHCARDFLSHCKGVPTGGLPAFMCLDKNMDQLSEGCQAAVKDVLAHHN